MGTPDLLGSYGEFTFFTPDAPLIDQRVDGGLCVHLTLLGHRGKAKITGPPNHLKEPSKSGQIDHLIIEFEVVRDADNPVAKIAIGDNLILLNAGEWSEWLPIDFDTGIAGSDVLNALAAPTKVPGMVRFFLKSVHPKLELYASPINIDPLRPVTPISQPACFAHQLAQRHGRFYTAGIPEDTKALQPGVLNEDEFLAQAMHAHHEKAKQYETALGELDSGCLFFYFGTSDLVSHMFWRDRDPGHPGRKHEQASRDPGSSGTSGGSGDRYAHVIDDLYAELDGLVGQALAQLRDEDTLIVMSDHGFNSFRRAFNVNTWLLENGYLVLTGTQSSNEPGFLNVDWSRTRSYALGLNGVYVNLKGRERTGTVTPGSEQQKLVDELAERLLAVRDVDGAPVFAQMDPGSRRYPQGDPRIRPDLIVGYAENYRVSWDSVLGGIADQVLVDNLERWSGDHCIADSLIPGVLLCNHKLEIDRPSLTDIAPMIHGALGISGRT